MLNSISYQNLILTGIIIAIMGILLVLMYTREGLTRLKAIISTILLIAVMFIVSYLILNEWNIITGALLVVILAIFCLVQNIMEKRESKEKIKESKRKCQ